MTDYDWDEACDLREQLRKYADYHYDSYSEMINALCALSQYPDYMSQELWNAVVEGMKRELKNYEENSQIVTTTETITREVVDLEWKY
jgi:hypothetical protein